jgi:CRP/FNR family transcriptional regulator
MLKQITPQTLKQFPLLMVLPEEKRQELINEFHTRSIHPGEILFHEGESSHNLYFVISGWLKAEKISIEGRQQVLRFIGPGEMINELAVFSNNENEVSIIAMEKSNLFSLPQEAIEDLLIQYPELARQTIRNLSARIQHLLKQVENLSLYSVEVRLARLLLDESQNNIFQRHSWRTQSEIASQLGTVLDVVNRHLTNLEQLGIIVVYRDQIIISNPEELNKIARR